ncbi:MAG: PEP-CTERM sorting domain-containing protein [Gammaproteobacteria bacterium]|nr:PEP-CTERM sorting domain-containing protein [Gammaproteobacteria bacterium]
MNKTLKTIACAATLMALASPASALVAVDGWQLDTTNGTNVGATLTTNIGHMNLSGGIATVEQEVNAGFTPFVGAEFWEYGVVHSITYTEENMVGLGDSGSPEVFDNGGGGLLRLELRFSGLTGEVTSYNAGTGEIEYKFDAGVGTIGLYGSQDDFGTEDLLASFSLLDPSGGDLSNFNGIGDQSQGQSTISSLVLDSITDLFRDSAGVSFDDMIDEADLYALVVTTNKISDPGFAPMGPCTNDATKMCVVGDVTSDGSFDLLVPEPSILVLMGMGLLGMGGFARKARSSS